MRRDSRGTYLASAIVAALMIASSALGLLFPGAYRDAAWIRAAWFGNDWVTLVVAAIAAVQGALYLLVLAVGSLVAVARGLAPAPGEAPLWGTLALVTAGAAGLLLASVRPVGIESRMGSDFGVTTVV
jgi:hypothetical protein